MKIMKYISLILVVALTVSCEKNVIEYNTTPITDVAEFQLHYMVPVVTATANNITRVEANGKLVSNSKATLSTYNAVPSGAVGRFYTVNPGNVNLKMYMTAKLEPKGDSLVYDQSVALTQGKQNIFVHAFDQVPVLFDNGFPYVARETVTTDSTAWVKFYNFLYETAGVPTTKIIQYQYVDSRSGARVNIGTPVAFGETTGWIPVTVVKSVQVSAGSRIITFRMQEIDPSGTVIGDLQVMSTTGTYAAYTATATLFIGRRYHHTMAGFRAVKSPNSSVRIFTAL
jgi:hypothetical protein